MNKKFMTYVLLANLTFAAAINASPVSSLPSLADVKNFIVDKKFAGGAVAALGLGYLGCLAYRKKFKKPQNQLLTSTCPKCAKVDVIQAVNHKCSQCSQENRVITV